MGHNDERRQPRPRRKFSDEFKRDAVDLVLTTGRPIAEVAAELGVYDSTLGNWVRQHQEQQQAGSAVSPDERARLKELEAENAKLRMERELLKRTVAFWVKESPQ
jgi:transposase